MVRTHLPLVTNKLWFGTSVLKRNTDSYVDNAFTSVKAGAEGRFSTGAQIDYNVGGMTPTNNRHIVWR